MLQNVSQFLLAPVILRIPLLDLSTQNAILKAEMALRTRLLWQRRNMIDCD